LEVKTQEKHYILFIALLQGLALLGMHNWVVGLANPDHHFGVIFPLYALIITLPLSLMMLVSSPRAIVIKLALGFSLVAAFCAAYVGYANTAKNLPNYYNNSDVYWLLGFCIYVAWFIVLAFFEHYCQFKHWANLKISRYEALFNFSWRNAVKIITAGIFALLFWGALALLAGLFKVLGILFFQDLITNRHFVYPATVLAFGLGLSLYTAKEEALAEFKRAILQVLGWLLPLVSFILLSFIITLPFKGLNLLWGTGYATALMLSLLGLTIFLLNAAFQDGNQIKYPNWLLQLTNIGLMTLPIYLGLCVYALYLRVHQYGWTAERVWGAALIALMAIYALGYAFAAIKSFKNLSAWMQITKPVNIIGAWFLVTLLCLLNSPLLNPVRIAVQSQVAKLIEGKVSATNFDYQYLRFSGGNYGNNALDALIKNTKLKDAATVKSLAEAALKAEYRNDLPEILAGTETLKTKIKIHPKNVVLDIEFYAAVLKSYRAEEIYLDCLLVSHLANNCQALVLDLNQDKNPEVIIFNNYEQRVFSKTTSGWRYIGALQSTSGSYSFSQKETLQKELESGDFKAVTPEWQQLQLGEDVFQLSLKN